MKNSQKIIQTIRASGIYKGDFTMPVKTVGAYRIVFFTHWLNASVCKS